MSVNDQKTFYDPHPGRGGCPLPLQTEVRQAAKTLDGCTLSLTKAFERIQSVARGEVKIQENNITLTVQGASTEYVWVVIRFR